MWSRKAVVEGRRVGTTSTSKTGASGAGLKFWKRREERVEGTERRCSYRRSGAPQASQLCVARR